MNDYIYQSADKPITNCYKSFPKRGRLSCGVCQSCKDQKHSYDVSRKHEYGKFCKGSDNNQCTVCADIKRRLRVIFHLAKNCMKWCPYCLGEGTGFRWFPKHTEEEYLEKSVKSMYRYFLHPRYGLWITHKKE